MSQQIDKTPFAARRWVRIVALSAGILTSALLLAGAHYALPWGEVVVPTGTEVMRFTNGVDEGSATTGAGPGAQSRDVRLFYARTPDGSGVRTYRNEDAVFFLKFDSGTINSKIQSILLDQARSKEELHVLAVSQGWRIDWLSMYPNLISLEVVPAGHTHYQWRALSIIVLMLLGFGAAGWWMVRLFRRASIAARAAADKATASLGQGITMPRMPTENLFRKWMPARTPKVTPPPPVRRPPPNVSSER